MITYDYIIGGIISTISLIFFDKMLPKILKESIIYRMLLLIY